MQFHLKTHICPESTTLSGLGIDLEIGDNNVCDISKKANLSLLQAKI